MIESIVFFVLGCLCAGFLALMIAPAFWRRAVILTRRRIEASVPLTLNEIQADKDKLRAEFAMATRRLEMEVKALKEKIAVETEAAGRNREELRRRGVDRGQMQDAVTALESSLAALREQLRERDEQLREALDRLDKSKIEMDARKSELKQLNGLYDEATYVSSDRQIALVGREAEIERLTDELARSTSGRRELERRAREAETERQAALETLALEQTRVGDLEAKNARMLATLADRDEELARRQTESERYRMRLKVSADGESDGTLKLVDALSKSAFLERQVDDLKQRLADVAAPSTPAEPGEFTSEDRRRLEHRLTTLTRDNRRLRTAALTQGLADNPPDERNGNTRLREKIGQLAAEVVNMTILLEGEDSPMAQAANDPASHRRAKDATGKSVVSLADRVRDLRKAAMARSQ